MLKYKIMQKNNTSDFEVIDVLLFTFMDDSIRVVCKHKHKLKNNDTITLIREDGIINYHDIIKVKVISDTELSIDNFAPISIFINNAYVISDNNVYCGTITPHTYIRNYKFNIREKIYDKNSDVTHLIEGDYVLYDDLYVHKVISNGVKLVVSELSENVFVDNISVDYNGVKYEFNGVIPVQINGYDDPNNIIINNISKAGDVFDIVNLYENIVLQFVDNRFFENNLLTNGTTINKTSGFYTLNIGSVETFASNLYQTDLVEDIFINKNINENINKYVDMEKFIFTPYSLNNDNTLNIVNTLNFNFHFRDRGDSIDWVTNDNLYWNGYEQDKNITNKVVLKPKLTDMMFGDEQSDLLGYLNFVNSDIIFQKNKLKKSFIRLSFYDTNDINTQQLLYYSTIFIDSNKLFGIYSDNSTSDPYAYLNIDGSYTDVIGVTNEYVKTNNINNSKRLSTHISVTNKYDTSSSSEGFYIYLFPETFKVPYIETIYMKVEFNHAGYGKTIPFIMPRTSNGDIIPLFNKTGDVYDFNEDFPISFLKINDDGSVYTDMEAYFDALFIKMELKCDYENNIFGYYLPNINNSDEITFNLFEPKIQ